MAAGQGRDLGRITLKSLQKITEAAHTGSFFIDSCVLMIISNLKKLKMKRVLGLIIVISAFAGCKKEKGDMVKPVITITSPQANQQFNAGQVINITATINDNSELHEVSVSISNKNTSAELVHNHYHADQMTFNVNETITAGAGITYRIKIGAADHSGNQTEMEVEVKGN